MELEQEAEGYFSGSSAAAQDGMHYKFQLDRGAFADPVSRFQPDGPFGASRIVDPAGIQMVRRHLAGSDAGRAR